MKKQRLRDKTAVDVKQSKQSTIDDISYQFNIQKSTANKPTKAIAINNIISEIKEDELALQVEFALLPSKASFSKVNLDLYFENQLIDSTTLAITQSPLLNDSFSQSLVLEMAGIAEGKYLIRVEMYEPWPDEKLNFNLKETIVEYSPQSRKERLVKIPTVKSTAGLNLTVVSSSARNLYRDLEQDMKEESRSQRDQW